MGNDRRWCPPIKLYNTERDRIIAAWVDQAVESPYMSYAAIVKDFLFELATTGQGGTPDNDKIAEEIARLTTQIAQLKTTLASGGYAASGQAQKVGEDEGTAILDKLGKMGT